MRIVYDILYIVTNFDYERQKCHSICLKINEFIHSSLSICKYFAYFFLYKINNYLNKNAFILSYKCIVKNYSYIFNIESKIIFVLDNFLRESLRITLTE